MLLELSVLNGVMTPKFDKYNNVYTIDVDDNIENLELDFKLSDGYNLNVLDNDHFLDGENIVTLEVYNDNELNKYTLIVNKKEIKNVFNYSYLTDDTPIKEELPEYVAPLIIGICLVIIILFYIIIFKHEKRN